MHNSAFSNSHMRIVLIVATLFAALFHLWSGLSSKLGPWTVISLLSTDFLLAALLFSSLIGLMRYQWWARQIVMGWLVSLLFIGISFLFIAPAGAFFGGLFMASLLGMTGLGYGRGIVIANLLLLGFPVLALRHLLKSENAELYVGNIDPDENFARRFLNQRNWIALVLAVLLILLPKAVDSLKWKFAQGGSREQLEAEIKELANSDFVKDAVRRQAEVDARLKEEAFTVREAYFLNDESNIILFTNEKSLYHLSIASGKVVKIGSNLNLHLTRRSVDVRFIFANGRAVYDVIERKLLTVPFEMANATFGDGREQIGIGFGPSPSQYLIFDQTTRTFVMRDILTGNETLRLAVPEVASAGLSASWFPSRKLVLMSQEPAQGMILLDLVNGKIISGEIGSGFAEHFLPDEAEQGFVILGDRHWSSKSYAPYYFNLPTVTRKPLDFDVVPLSMSIQGDRFVGIKTFEKKIQLRRPSSGFALTTEFQVEGDLAVHPKGSRYVLVEGERQVLAYDLESKTAAPLGRAFQRTGRGRMYSSPGGHLVVHIDRRNVQVLWLSEIGKPIPRFLQTEIQRD